MDTLEVLLKKYIPQDEHLQFDEALAGIRNLGGIPFPESYTLKASLLSQSFSQAFSGAPRDLLDLLSADVKTLYEDGQKIIENTQSQLSAFGMQADAATEKSIASFSQYVTHLETLQKLVAHAKTNPLLLQGQEGASIADTPPTTSFNPTLEDYRTLQKMYRALESQYHAMNALFQGLTQALGDPSLSFLQIPGVVAGLRERVANLEAIPQQIPLDLSAQTGSLKAYEDTLTAIKAALGIPTLSDGQIAKYVGNLREEWGYLGAIRSKLGPGLATTKYEDLPRIVENMVGLKASHSQMEQLKKDYDALLQAIGCDEYKTPEDRAKNAPQILERARTMLNGLRGANQEIQRLTDELNSHKEKYDSTQAENTQLRNQISGLESHLHDPKEPVVLSPAEGTSALASTLDTANAQLGALTEKYARIKTALGNPALSDDDVVTAIVSLASAAKDAKGPPTKENPLSPSKSPTDFLITYISQPESIPVDSVNPFGLVKEYVCGVASLQKQSKLKGYMSDTLRSHLQSLRAALGNTPQESTVQNPGIAYFLGMLEGYWGISLEQARETLSKSNARGYASALDTGRKSGMTLLEYALMDDGYEFGTFSLKIPTSKSPGVFTNLGARLGIVASHQTMDYNRINKETKVLREPNDFYLGAIRQMTELYKQIFPKNPLP